MILVLGFTSTSNHAEPTVIYAGNSGSAAESAVSASTFPRLERIDHPHLRRIRGFTEDRLEKHQAAQRAAKSNTKGFKSVAEAASEIDKLRMLLTAAESRATAAEERAAKALAAAVTAPPPVVPDLPPLDPPPPQVTQLPPEDGPSLPV
jgi:hypothetical protein